MYYCHGKAEFSAASAQCYMILQKLFYINKAYKSEF